MIQGALNWNNKKIWYIQTNNAIENYNLQTGIKGFLETCGPSSACICMSALYLNIFAAIEKINVQPEDLLFVYLLNPKNYNVKIPNRLANCYPKAVKDLYNVESKVIRDLTFSQVADILRGGKAIQFAFYKPLHFNAMVAYDCEKKVILRVDPWPKNPMNKKGGWLEEITEIEFKTNVKSNFIIYE